jgi:hypothetical protein
VTDNDKHFQNHRGDAGQLNENCKNIEFQVVNFKIILRRQQDLNPMLHRWRGKPVKATALNSGFIGVNFKNLLPSSFFFSKFTMVSKGESASCRQRQRAIAGTRFQYLKFPIFCEL